MWKIYQNLMYKFTTNSNLLNLKNMSSKYQNIMRIQLNHPAKRNALSIQLTNQIDSTIKIINNKHNIRACIITSAEEGMFCAGADLKQRLNKTPQDIENIVCNLRRVFNDFRHIHCPVICIIDGPALGGGLQLALNADIRIATKNALIGLPETSWSLIPGAGGTQTLSRVIGVAKAKQLIFTSRKLKGLQAFDWGVVQHFCETNEEAEKKALSIIDEILPNAQLAVKHAKKAINWGYETDLKSGLQIERFNYERILHTEDRIQGFLAFAQKRKPSYKGQ